jgi:putative DNA primase/helicase
VRRRVAAEVDPLPGAVGLSHAQQRQAKAAIKAILNEVGTEKATDWNDLHQREGLPIVRAQIEGHLAGCGWLADRAPRAGSLPEGGGDTPMAARLSVDEAALRYWGTYGFGGKLLFDEAERRLVHKDDVINLLPRHGWDSLKEHPDWRVARDWEIGFDPAQSDPKIRCNLYGGWPTRPKEGRCDTILELLAYLCSNEGNSDALYQWILDWLAYPIQRPGAKMHSALVVHGPQGTGKNLFFEIIAAIYGEYGRVLGQEALEDKFNSDWAEKKLFILADEVLARQDMFHVKNRLKSFITGNTIRVNPKNIAAHNERNCMNIVFLSNERMPVVLENDDRRHCIIWSPPKLSVNFFEDVVAERDAGGIAALHHFLLQRDLSHFGVSSHPPMTQAKADLILQGASSEERFIAEWIAAELVGANGEPLPVCPCLGSDLYASYRRWCERFGERPRRAQELIGHCAKLPGWSAGRTANCWHSFQDRRITKRKLVIPSPAAMEAAIAANPDLVVYRRDRYGSDTEWHTNGLFGFQSAIDMDQSR